MVGGKVAAVADTPEELVAEMERIEPDRTKVFVFRGDGDYETTDDIWRI